MTNRRRFLQLGMGAAAAAILPAGALAAAASQGIPFPVFRILHDTRFPGSLDLASSLQETLRLDCAPMQALAGDITRFWHNELSGQWRKSPDAIAGVTGEDILFCLEQLARDNHLRVQWRHSVATKQAGEAGGKPVAWVIARA